RAPFTGSHTDQPVAGHRSLHQRSKHRAEDQILAHLEELFGGMCHDRLQLAAMAVCMVVLVMIVLMRVLSVGAPDMIEPIRVMSTGILDMIVPVFTVTMRLMHMLNMPVPAVTLRTPR